ncbi:MAG: rRNA adenine N-6-methyltransferase family protein [Alistipes indistinctus]
MSFAGFYDIEYLFTVSEGVFNPPPKVKSAVIRLPPQRRAASSTAMNALFMKVVKGDLQPAPQDDPQLPAGRFRRFWGRGT